MKTIVVIAVLMIGLYAFYKIYQQSNIDSRLEQKVAAGAIILDVRTPGEYRGGHIEGAMNIPLSRLHEGWKALDPSKVYITCCSHGLRSVKAQSILRGHGFKQVFNGGPWTELEPAVLRARRAGNQR